MFSLPSLPLFTAVEINYVHKISLTNEDKGTGNIDTWLVF